MNPDILNLKCYRCNISIKRFKTIDPDNLFHEKDYCVCKCYDRYDTHSYYLPNEFGLIIKPELSFRVTESECIIFFNESLSKIYDDNFKTINLNIYNFKINKIKSYINLL